MQRCKNFILLSGLCLILAGCATFKEVNEVWENLEKIEIGMSRGEVITIMGSPYDKEVIVLEDGTSIEFLKYVTSYGSVGPVLLSDTSPICLEQNIVIGMGRKFYKNKRKNLKTLYHRK